MIAGSSNVPSPGVLLSIQLAGGCFAVIPILTLKQFTKLTPILSGKRYESVYAWIIGIGGLNVILSAYLVFAFHLRLPPLAWVMEENHTERLWYLFRFVVVYDMALLGALVWSTGGPEHSVFTLQFMAILPLAVLASDTISWNIYLAVLFILAFLAALLVKMPWKFEYLPDKEKHVWVVAYLFLFVIVPVLYDVYAKSSKGNVTERSPAAAHVTNTNANSAP